MALTYSLENDFDGTFALDDKKIKILKTLSPGATYNLVVLATDINGWSQRISAIVKTEPVYEDQLAITSSPFFSAPENYEFSTTLKANKPVFWTIIGGADSQLYTLSSSTGVLTLEAKNFENPVDSNGDNKYIVKVRATSYSGETIDQIISGTITNVVDAEDVV